MSMMALARDGTTLAVGVWESVRLYQVGSWKYLGTLAGHQHVVQLAAFSPGGRILATASIDGTIKLWNLAAKQEVATLRGHVDAVNGIAFSADGRILASVGRDKTVRLWPALHSGKSKRRRRRRWATTKKESAKYNERAIGNASPRDDRNSQQFIAGHCI